MLFLPSHEGQALVEYAMILFAIFMVVVMAAGLVGKEVFKRYVDIKYLLKLL